MPTHYAHIVFGRKVLQALPEDLAKKVSADQAAFYVGLHGPDPLFYYHPLTPNAVSRLGSAIHDEPGAAFFEKARSVMHTMATPSRRSYLAGFLCHYMLDSRCHPYIDGHPSLSHHLIETELDRALMEKERLTPGAFDPLKHIQPSRSLGLVIEPFYPGTTARQWQTCLSSMKKICRVLSNPSAPLQGILLGGMRLGGLYDQFHGLILRPQPHPACLETSRVLMELLEDEVAETASQMALFLSALDNGDAFSSRLNLTFGGDAL